MKLVGAISTAVLTLTLGIGIPAYAHRTNTTAGRKKTSLPRKKKRKHNRKNQRSRKRKTRNSKKRTPSRKRRTAQEQHTTSQARAARPASRKGSMAAFPPTATRPISDSEHSFRVSEGDYRNHRFQYGGYWFGFVPCWPSNWLYTQDVYVIEIDGVYYLCNASYPGVNLMLNVTTVAIPINEGCGPFSACTLFQVRSDPHSLDLSSIRCWRFYANTDRKKRPPMNGRPSSCRSLRTTSY